MELVEIKVFLGDDPVPSDVTGHCFDSDNCESRSVGYHDICVRLV